MHLAIGNTLLAPGQLRQLPIDVAFFRDDALLDLHHGVAPLAELFLEIGAQLDRLLARFDRRLTTCGIGFATRVVQKERPLPPRRVETRPRHEPQPGERRTATDCQCDNDCDDNEHWRLLGLVQPAERRIRRSKVQARLRRAPRIQVRFSF